MRSLVCVLGVASVSSLCFAQAPPRLEFEVASVKSADPIDGNSGATASIGMHIDGAQVRFTSLALRDLLRLAYRMKTYQIEGPDWIVTERYDISAKLPQGAKRDDVPEMLVSLLNDRFQIVAHHTKKEFPVLGLVVAKSGLKMKPAAPDPEADAAAANATNIAATGGPQGISVSFGKNAYYTFANNKFEVRHLTMQQVADSLARYETDPVLDMTGAAGAYDFDLPLTQEEYQGMLIRAAISAGVSLPPGVAGMAQMATGDSLGAALDAVGLKLEKRKAPLDVLVVDKANQKPTSN